MSTDRLFTNPDFVNYAHLLYDLHVAIREGWDDTPEGEAVRERMDEAGSRLSREEITSLNGISADFYSLTDDPPAQISPITAEVMADFETARRSPQVERVQSGTGIVAQTRGTHPCR